MTHIIRVNASAFYLELHEVRRDKNQNPWVNDENITKEKNKRQGS